MTPVLLDRRRFLASLGAGMALVVLKPGFAAADIAQTQEEIAAAVGDASRAQTGRIGIDMPPLAESGNSVPMTIRVDSPMTEADHCRRVWVFAEGNPRPRVCAVTFTPRAGKAEFSTKIRMARTQNIIAFAEMSDGSLWTQTLNVMVTVGACETLIFRP